ncbi:MAG: ISNCY family transposase [Myxococcota bacterium]|nr:ISNCY family transposase [Myxococcota bacterium]
MTVNLQRRQPQKEAKREMRKIRWDQLPLVGGGSGHPHSKELDEIARILDSVPEIAQLAMKDLVPEGVNPSVGNPGMTAIQVVKAGIIKQMHGYSYVELEFHLADSAAFRTFMEIGFADGGPSASALQENIKRLKPSTWEAINLLLVKKAQEAGIDEGRKVRVDSTVTESNIHDPDDAAQLWDTVRVLGRLLEQARGAGFAVGFNRRMRRAKRRRLGVLNAKDEAERRKQYRDLVHVTEEVIGYAERAVAFLERTGSPEAMAYATDLRHFIELGKQVVDVTRRRVFQGEKVPASEKIVSIFEPHTDVIIKDRRQVLFGHKVFFTVGASSLVLDCVIADGNPADSEMTVPMIDRVTEITGKVPKKVALDGGFASRANLEKLKARGVKDVCFSKGRGLSVEEMVQSKRVYKKLWRFRAGIEGVISFLKRGFGLVRAMWRGEVGFQSYVWASVVSANLLVMARRTAG